MIVSEHSELLSEGGKGGKAGISIDEDLGVQEGPRGAWGHVIRRWPTWFLKHSVLIPRAVSFVFCPEISSPSTASTEESQV